LKHHRPNQAWVSDITISRTRSGWLCLAAALTLYLAQDCIGRWSPRDASDAGVHSPVVRQRKPAAGLVVHSTGERYASATSRAVEKYGHWRAYCKGNCWITLSCIFNLKMERVWQKTSANHNEAMTDVAGLHRISTAYDCIPNWQFVTQR
jgi:hypothetical protein